MKSERREKEQRGNVRNVNRTEHDAGHYLGQRSHHKAGAGRVHGSFLHRIHLGQKLIYLNLGEPEVHAQWCWRWHCRGCGGGSGGP